MQWSPIERDLLMQPLVIVCTWHGVLEELSHRLVDRHEVLAMDLRPDSNELAIQRLKHDRALVLQELDVEQGLLMEDVPVRVRDLQGQQHIRIGEHWVLVREEDRFTGVVPLRIHNADFTVIPSDLGRRQKIEILRWARVTEPVIGCS